MNDKDYEEFNKENVDFNETGSLKGSDDEGGEHYQDFNELIGMENPNLCKGMRFSNKEIYLKALREWAIRRGFHYVLNKSTSQRVRALCKDNCGFRIHASKLRESSVFQIKTFKA